MFRLIVALVLFAAVGCAARSSQVPQAAYPGSIGDPSEAEPENQPDVESAVANKDIDTLEAKLQRDHDELEFLLSKPAQSASSSAASNAPGGSNKMSGEVSGEMVPKGGQNRCNRACRAADSMQQAAHGICRLAGVHHERCKTAQRKVQSAEQRLTKAGCKC